MPRIFINGQPVEAERNQTVMEAARANGFFIPYFCWHPQLSVAGNCRICAIQIEDRSWVEIACNMPVSEGLRVLTDSDVVKEYRKAHHAALDAESSGRLRHLRQVRRVHAAGLSLPVQRRAVDFARRQGARDQVPPALRAHRARQRALHPLLALRALHARDIEVERARHHAARRRLAGARGRGPSARRRSVLGQRHRHLPGRRAAVAVVPLPGAGLVSGAHAFGLPGMRSRLHGAGLAPQGGVEAPHARPEARTSRSSASRRSKIRRSTARGSATRDAISRRSSSGRAPLHAMQKGKPVELAVAIASARALHRRSQAPCRLRVELGLQRGARRVQASARRPLQDVREAGLHAGAGRAGRGRIADPGGQESEYGGRARAIRLRRRAHRLRQAERIWC